MMQALAERLKLPGPLLADGAMGTMLMRHGLKPGDCPESFNLGQPEVLRTIAEGYVRAGADIIQANTFGGSPLKLAAYGLGDRVREINAQAIRIARAAAGGRAYVAASCGPSGTILEPYGDTSADAVLESFSVQMEVFVGEGVDLICIETMTDLAEAVLALRAAKSLTSALPVAVTLTYDPTPRGFRTIMGTGIGETVRVLTDAGADIIGSNCGNGTAAMEAIAGDFVRETSLPVLIQPNAGLPVIRDGETVYPEGPDQLSASAGRLRDLGVKIIGGCCGTTAEHISAMRSVLG